jgi:hypothetical protein
MYRNHADGITLGLPSARPCPSASSAARQKHALHGARKRRTAALVAGAPSVGATDVASATTGQSPSQGVQRVDRRRAPSPAHETILIWLDETVPWSMRSKATR